MGGCKMKLMVQWENDGEDEIEIASLYNVCEWFIENYPDDIFVSKDNPVHKIRDLCKEILNKKKSNLKKVQEWK